MTQQQQRPEGSLQKNALEWSVFAVSLALVAGVLGVLVYAALHERSAPPQFTTTLGDVQPQRGGFRVPVRIENTGDETAAQVLVEVAAGGETAQVTFQYVPRRSVREGMALFKSRPTAPTVHIVGYQLP